MFPGIGGHEPNPFVRLLISFWQGDLDTYTKPFGQGLVPIEVKDSPVGCWGLLPCRTMVPLNYEKVDAQALDDPLQKTIFDVEHRRSLRPRQAIECADDPFAKEVLEWLIAHGYLLDR